MKQFEAKFTVTILTEVGTSFGRVVLTQLSSADICGESYTY